MTLADGVMTAEDFMKQAIVTAENGDYVAAVQFYDQTIQLNPDHARAYGNRGMVRANLGDKRGAISDWRKAGELFLAQRSPANYEMVMSYIKKLE